jgi:type IV pilus assembly protein PilZ
MPDNNPLGTEKPIEIVFKNSNALYKAYMPYLGNGGLFVTHQAKWALGQKVLLHVTLPNEPVEEKHALETTIAWITPTSAQGRWIAGIGLEFSTNEASRRVREKINVLLLANAEKDTPTGTM